MKLVVNNSISKTYRLYTDGACSGNPGPGGWGVIIKSDSSNDQELYGHEPHTTNNRMELMAAIKGIEALPLSSDIALYTDSLYLRDGMTKWILKWKINEWQAALSKQIKNLDLWKQLDHLSHHYNIQWHWIRGHSGHVENSRADLLARTAIVQLLMQEAMQKKN